jgi:NitT/TauT family transport system substrate-binding protein
MRQNAAFEALGKVASGRGKRMRRKRFRSLAAGAVVLALVAAACGDDGGDSGGGDGGGGADCESTDQVSLQLQWFIQAQFAGYFAAQEQGFYADQCL